MEFIWEPMEIERRSLEIIETGLAGKEIADGTRSVVKRVIHTTADFDYAENLVFSDGAVEAARAALRSGAKIITDTNMARSGINKKALAALGGEAHCFIDSEEVAAQAAAKGTTRAGVAVEYALSRLDGPLIFAVGNAPTALIKLVELISRGECDPALVIAVPVGFVNVVEAKELIMRLDIPHIAAKGRKGGSNVAAAICNALMYDIVKRG